MDILEKFFLGGAEYPTENELKKLFKGVSVEQLGVGLFRLYTQKYFEDVYLSFLKHASQNSVRVSAFYERRIVIYKEDKRAFLKEDRLNGYFYEKFTRKKIMYSTNELISGIEPILFFLGDGISACLTIRKWKRDRTGTI